MPGPESGDGGDPSLESNFQGAPSEIGGPEPQPTQPRSQRVAEALARLLARGPSTPAGEMLDEFTRNGLMWK